MVVDVVLPAMLSSRGNIRLLFFILYTLNASRLTGFDEGSGRRSLCMFQWVLILLCALRVESCSGKWMEGGSRTSCESRLVCSGIERLLRGDLPVTNLNGLVTLSSSSDIVKNWSWVCEWWWILATDVVSICLNWSYVVEDRMVILVC